MTIKKIIHSLECQAQDKDRLAGGDPNSDFTKDATALYEAIRKLRAKLDRIRWEGCPMCTAHYTKYDWNTYDVGAHEFRVSGSSLMYCDQLYGWEGIGIHFCPNCGRPLTEEAWAELERRINGGADDV